jgi:hypothetical protein
MWALTLQTEKGSNSLKGALKQRSLLKQLQRLSKQN